MAITADTLRWYQSERMTDEDDGGGQMAGVEIVPGVENQVFDDLSDVDRAAGDVSIRKIYAAVGSADADKYLDAGVVVFRPPADPDVSVTVFSTGDYYDERAALQARLESQVVRGGVYQGWLWGDHIIGQRSVTLWQRMSAPLPAIGQRIELVKRASSTTVANQFLWLTRITTQDIERQDSSGLYQVRMIVAELAEPLRYDFVGIEPQRTDPTTQGANGTLVYETRYNPGAVNIFGIAPLVAEAETGDYTVQVDSLYKPLIPTAFAETPLADVNPGGDWATLVAGRPSGTVSWTTALDTVKPGASLFTGGPVLPGTLTVSVSGAVYSDEGGTLRSAAGTDVGTIDYSNGIITWSSACPVHTGATKTVAYMPAAVPMRVANTAPQWVTLENRGFVWVRTLTPVPAPRALRVSYRANNEWYTLIEQGDGTLKGVDSSYGSGSLDYGTGTVTITTGALPDPESEILYAWGTAVDYIARGGAAVDPLKVTGQTAHPGVVPGSFALSWSGVSLTDNSAGLLTGTGGSGTIDYATGIWAVTPTTVPSMGTAYTLEYDWGEVTEETFADVHTDFDGKVNLDLSAGAVEGSVRIEYQIAYGRVIDQVAKDDGAGAITVPHGSPGTIDYGTGEISFPPAATWTVVVDDYEYVQE